MSCSQNALKSMEKEVILSWKSLETTVRFLYEPCSYYSTFLPKFALPSPPGKRTWSTWNS